MVQEPGPNTLALEGSLIDVVSYYPPEDTIITSYYLSELGAATLVLELSDSMSGQILARASDRRSVETNTFAANGTVVDANSLIESNPVTNRFELEIELRQWANTIRNGLEFLLDVPILPAGN